MPTLNQLKDKIESMIVSQGGDAHVAYSLWTAPDVVVLTHKDYLTAKQIDDVLDDVHHNFDAGLGISWDSINNSICNIKG